MLPEFAAWNNIRFSRVGGIKPILLDTAKPRFLYYRFAGAFASLRDNLDFAYVVANALGHSTSSPNISWIEVKRTLTRAYPVNADTYYI